MLSIRSTIIFNASDVDISSDLPISSYHGRVDRCINLLLGGDNIGSEVFIEFVFVHNGILWGNDI